MAQFLAVVAEEEREWRARVKDEMERQTRRAGTMQEQVAFRAVETQQPPVRVRPEPEEEDHPFKVTSFLDGGTWKFRVSPGSYDGVIPTLGGTSLEDGPEGTLGTGTKYVYIKAQHELLATDDYVYSGFLDGDPEIVVESTERTDPLGPNTSGEYYLILATFEDGEKTGQYLTSSTFVEVADDGTASSSASLFATGVFG